MLGERFLEVEDAQEEETGRALMEPLGDILGGDLLDLDVDDPRGFEVFGELGVTGSVLLLALGEDVDEGMRAARPA